MTVGHGCLPNLVGDGTIENSWGSNSIPRLLYKKYIILWFEFDLCGCLHWRDREESLEASQSVKYYLRLSCWLRFYYGDGLYLWLLGAVVYLTLLETALLKTVEVQTEYLDYCTSNIQSFGSSLVCVVSNIDETRKLDCKLARQWKTTYLWVVKFFSILVTVFAYDCCVRLSN